MDAVLGVVWVFHVVLGLTEKIKSEIKTISSLRDVICSPQNINKHELALFVSFHFNLLDKPFGKSEIGMRV